MGAVVAAHPIEVPVETGDGWTDLGKPGDPQKHGYHMYRAQSSLAQPCSHQLGQQQAAVASLVVANYLLGLLTHAFCMRNALHLLVRLVLRATHAGIHQLHRAVRATLARAGTALTARTPAWLTHLLAHWLAPLVAGLLLVHPRCLTAAAPATGLLYAAAAAAAMPHRLQDLSVLPTKLAAVAAVAAAGSGAALLRLDLVAQGWPLVAALLRCALAGACCQLYLVLYYAYRHQQACSWVLLKLLLLCAAAPHPAWSWRVLTLTEKLRLLTQLQFHAPPAPPRRRHPTYLLLQRLSRLLLAACLVLVPPGELQAASFVPRGCIHAVQYVLLTLAVGCAASWLGSVLLLQQPAAAAAAGGALAEPTAPRKPGEAAPAPALACSWRWATSAAAVVALVVPTLAAVGGPDQGAAHRWAGIAMRALSVVDISLAAVATLRGLGTRPGVV